MTEYLQVLNVLIIPIWVWVIKVERRLTRIETTLNGKNQKRRKGDVE